MERQPLNNSGAVYRISPTLLDSFHGYINSDDTWEKYWGRLDNPKKTKAKFHAEKFDELIKYINREERTVNEAAERGTAFNEIVDIRLGNPAIGIANIGVNADDGTDFIVIDGKKWVFPIELVDNICERLEGAVCQQRLEGVIGTRFGRVLLTGYADHILGFKIVDLKTTGEYTLGQFRANHQHLAYPYICEQLGVTLTEFEYLVVQWYASKVDGRITRWEVFTEQYLYDAEKTEYALRRSCEQLIEFVENNRHFITNNHIFNQTTP